jgi:hypothetical protein
MTRVTLFPGNCSCVACMDAGEVREQKRELYFISCMTRTSLSTGSRSHLLPAAVAMPNKPELPPAMKAVERHIRV